MGVLHQTQTKSCTTQKAINTPGTLMFTLCLQDQIKLLCNNQSRTMFIFLRTLMTVFSFNSEMFSTVYFFIRLKKSNSLFTSITQLFIIFK